MKIDNNLVILDNSPIESERERDNLSEGQQLDGIGDKKSKGRQPHEVK